jgi:hypothetical protein
MDWMPGQASCTAHVAGGSKTSPLSVLQSLSIPWTRWCCWGKYLPWLAAMWSIRIIQCRGGLMSVRFGVNMFSRSSRGHFALSNATSARHTIMSYMSEPVQSTETALRGNMCVVDISRSPVIRYGSSSKGSSQPQEVSSGRSRDATSYYRALGNNRCRPGTCKRLS